MCPSFRNLLTTSSSWSEIGSNQMLELTLGPSYSLGSLWFNLSIRQITNNVYMIESIHKLRELNKINIHYLLETVTKFGTLHFPTHPRKR